MKPGMSAEVIQFHAPWCRPCRALSPRVEALSHQFAGRLEVRRVDVQEHPEEAQRWGVRGVPTLVALRDGQEVSRLSGTSPDELEPWFEALAAGRELPRRRFLGSRTLAALGGFALLWGSGLAPEPWRLAGLLGLPLVIWGMAPGCAVCGLTTQVFAKAWRRWRGR